ncbi:MAG: DEAD/DEAH box helicase family protein [Methanocorpusculum sp.]|nr:DEAD/DEAH box helicase family protein [Methanocorpusculum sp.]
MSAVKIKTSRPAFPQIYAYTTPEIPRHKGWTKIGYTEQEVHKRIRQQTHTADVEYELEWSGNAIYEDGTGERFTDDDFHVYLRKSGIEQENSKDNEWFHISGRDSKQMFYEFRENHGILDTLDIVIPYTLREEQQEAVEKTLAFQKSHEYGEFLWNAKPRFGKTLATYDFCKRSGAKNILILTNRPAIANSWFSDYARFLGSESGYFFVSEVDALKEKAGVLSRHQFSIKQAADPECKCIEFVSLQDLKGSLYFGGKFDKLSELAEMEWDLLIVDEAHEGVDTSKTDFAFDRIKRKFTLHLSGTPFKALANAKFADDAIYNWTYADEQRRKQEWESNDGVVESPYAVLPKLNLFTYQMSEIVKDEIEQGIDLEGNTEEYAFDLNEFFKVDENGKYFKYASSVDRFLDALVQQEKFPFSTEELRNELKHTFWLLDRVESAWLLAKTLKNHPVFKDYKIVLAAGDGKLDEESENQKSYDKVVQAIREHDKTITLSVGQLTTGITIPEWTAVLMLSNVKSPALYMQAAFRAQNPCLFKEGTGFKRKENAYVFDFDPARTLVIFEEFANDLSANTAAGKGDAETRKENIRELLNFFPVIGEDENGVMIELDATKVLEIPRKIRSVEVVKRGFMSNFLFQNISNVFSAPKEVMDLITSFEAVEEPKLKTPLSEDTQEELFLDDKGDVSVPEEFVIGQAAGIFGEKIYNVQDNIAEMFVESPKEEYTSGSFKNKLKSAVKDGFVTEMIQTVKDAYSEKPKVTGIDRIEKNLNHEADKLVERLINDYETDKKIIEAKREIELQTRDETHRSTDDINREYDSKIEAASKQFKLDLGAAVDEFIENSQKEVIISVETNIREKEKKSHEENIRNHLRGFSRTIPSFLMAYGNETVTLENFDKIIPPEVFLEVTGITLSQFCFLRDGGTYIDEDTGEEKFFAGNLFDPIVFNDSVKEFLNKKYKLANYFEDTSTEDIFDYIPPQATNQIFTPKKVVKKMVDMLEEENPGCFDNPDKTFIDIYMKSGMYITEIVKRLYQSETMKELFPDKGDRLRHIFEKQVFGLAPTEIIYKIAISYILGFSKDIPIYKNNFRQFDAVPSAKAGTLEETLDTLYPEN